MIKIQFPGITQEQFEDAFAVLEECKASPCLGFRHPFMAPGGLYGHCWWERDSSLTLNGYCWLDQAFAEKALENFTYVQKENGRIPLWGNDRVGNLDEQLSAIPVLFDVARRICRRTTDKDYIRRIYGTLCRYLDWWLSPIKRDARTGLICGIMEETDPADYDEQLTYAPVDLNVQVCVGADVLREMAEYLGEEEDAVRYRALFYELRSIINKWLYDENTGCYYTRQVKDDVLMLHRPYNSTFDTFKRKIVPEERILALLAVLKDNAKYGYDNPYGITTSPYDSAEFCETVGDYQGPPSWCGNVWTLRNEIISHGLRESGYREEASHIAYQTVMTFNGKYTEFVNPSTGAGQGVQRYGWSASEYVELIVEGLFGVDYCAWTDTLTVDPRMPKAFDGQTVSLSNLDLGNGEYLHVTVKCGDEPEVTYHRTKELH